MDVTRAGSLINKGVEELKNRELCEGWGLRQKVLRKSGSVVQIDTNDLEPNIRQKLRGHAQRAGHREPYIEDACPSDRARDRADSDFVPALTFARREQLSSF